jgi:hypothetical protein
VLEFNGFNSLISPFYSTASQRIFRESFSPVLEFNRLILESPSRGKDSFEKDFRLVLAWCLNLAPKGANLTGLIPVKFLNFQAQAETLSRKVFSQFSPGAGI